MPQRGRQYTPDTADGYQPGDNRVILPGGYVPPSSPNPYGSYDAPIDSVFNRRPPPDELEKDASGYVPTPGFLDNPYGLSTTILGGYKGSGPTGTGDLFAGNESNFVGAVGIRNLLIKGILERLGQPSAFGTADKLETSGNALSSQLGLSGRDISSDAYSRATLQNVVDKNALSDLMIKLYGQGGDIFSTSTALFGSARNRGNAKQEKNELELRQNIRGLSGGLISNV